MLLPESVSQERLAAAISGLAIRSGDQYDLPPTERGAVVSATSGTYVLHGLSHG